MTNTSNKPMVTDSLKTLAQFEPFNQWMFEQFSKYIDYKCVLELGSGLGSFSKFLLQSERLCLTEYDESYLAHLREEFKQSHIEVRPIDLEDLDTEPFTKKPFSTIICLNVLEHIKNDTQALKRIASLMTPNSVFILLVPSHPFLYGAIDKEAGHYRRYSKKDLLNVLHQNGLEVLCVKHFNRISAMGWWVKGKLLKQTNIKSSDVNIINRLLPILKLEKYFPIPFGQSIITVCQLKKI